VNYLWVWGSPTARSRTIFAEFSDQDSIDTYGISEGVVSETGTTSVGILKAKAINQLAYMKDPSVDIGISILGDGSLEPGKIIFLDSAYLASRKRYFVQNVKQVFGRSGYFTELLLVKV